MNFRSSRRKFLKQATWAAAGAWLAGSSRFAHAAPKVRLIAASDKLNIGVIGTANRAAANIKGVEGENIVAICDVDENLLDAAAQRFPNAKKFTDFRKLIDQKGIDAIVVSTPDHTHAFATALALRAGRHVYCEKPLTHTVSEARMIARLADDLKLATQMGNQIHASNNYRRVVELVQSNVIGPIREVHVWVGTVWEPMARPIEIVPVPAYLNYDVWLGPAQYRPYHPEYLPKNWRRWWSFGGGTMADFGCHYMDLPHWALNLRYPITVEAEGPAAHPECAPPWMIAHFDYPSRDAQPPVRLTWYQGGKRPPHFEQGQLPKWGNGVLFVGQHGMLLADYNKHVLLPEKTFADFKAPEPFIPDSIGHHAEWILACKTGTATTCNFDYTAALTETVLLGNVAHRASQKIEWDADKLKAVNCPAADEFIQHDYRSGWRL
ncbi:MAG: Gfo/Idh/MocA family oxidoreductase [Verrucomicrobiota bacterium]